MKTNADQFTGGDDMIQIAIVEDDKHYGKLLNRYIEKYQEESGIRFHVHTFQDGEDIVEDYKGIYDIILMDIEMKFMDGMTAAEEIRKVDSQVVIIFITNMPQYAMKGYAVEALDYVLKPINYYSFSQRIDRAISRMDKRKEKYLSISNKGTVQKIELSRLFYVEVQDHDLFYHTKDGVFSQRGTIKEVETALEREPFFRCNKCYLINLEYVERFEGSNVIVGDDEVQVSRSRKKELLEALNNYMNEVSK
jgi:DNA-binding LytR/AlgR family response regulator